MGSPAPAVDEAPGVGENTVPENGRDARADARTFKARPERLPIQAVGVLVLPHGRERS